MSAPRELLRGMVEELSAKGELPEQWREAFLAVPRHAFIPDTVWRWDEDAEDDYDLVPLRRADDPEAWLELAYADKIVTIQVDDGKPTGPGLTGYEPTSSASMPSMVATMLAALEVEPGMSVCEIGTGTGYNAALLAHRLSAENVTTIEVDPQLAGRARQALADIGYSEVTVIVGDGAAGYPPRAPFDRILSTASCQRVPYPWVAQTRSGGRIVTPWKNGYVGALLALTVDEASASGRIVGPSWFMGLRDQRISRTRFSEVVLDDDQPIETTTDIHPYYVAWHYDAQLAIGLQVPDCEHQHRPYCDCEKCGGKGVLWLLDSSSRSWASLTYTDPDIDEGEFAVRQFGPRTLWDEVEAVYRWWVDAGSPAAERWRFTVSPQGQRVELA